METSVPGIFAGGNVVHVHDLVDNVTWEAEKAGASAAWFAMEGKVGAGKKIRLKAGENMRYVLPHSISGEGKVILYGRVKEPKRKVELHLGEVWSKKLKVVKPSEMIKIELSKEEVRKIGGDVKELVLECKVRE